MEKSCKSNNKRYKPPVLSHCSFVAPNLKCGNCGASLDYEFLHEDLWCGCTKCSGLGDFLDVRGEETDTC